MVLKLDLRDVVFILGILAACAGLWVSLGIGPVLILVGLAAAGAAKFLEVAPCSSKG